jgi:hypothetical protein
MGRRRHFLRPQRYLITTLLANELSATGKIDYRNFYIRRVLQALSRLGEGRRFQMDFDAVSDDPDMEFAMVDATIVKVHRHAQGAKGDPKLAIDKSKGGWTTKSSR